MELEMVMQPSKVRLVMWPISSVLQKIMRAKWLTPMRL
jgi:hypothetical protein